MRLERRKRIEEEERIRNPPPEPEPEPEALPERKHDPDRTEALYQVTPTPGHKGSFCLFKSFGRMPTGGKRATRGRAPQRSRP